MAAPIRLLRDNEEKITLERERLRVRAKELQRQRAVLENEILSPGASVAEKEYIQQRIKTLSDDEDAINQKMAKIEPELARLQKEFQERLVTQERRKRSVTAAQQARMQPNPESPRAAALVRQYERAQKDREQQYQALKARARKTMILVAVAALFVAGVADILSLLDFGWVVSWSIPLITWTIVRRIGVMDRSVQAISEAQNTALQKAKVMRQRLRPQLAAQGKLRLFISIESLEAKQVVRSYVSAFIRDTVITQIAELIPVVDWLPLYLGQVVKLMIDERRAYRQTQDALQSYRQALDLLAQLELFEVGALAQNPVPQTAQPRLRTLSPAFAA